MYSAGKLSYRQKSHSIQRIRHLKISCKSCIIWKRKMRSCSSRRKCSLILSNVLIGENIHEHNICLSCSDDHHTDLLWNPTRLHTRPRNTRGSSHHGRISCGALVWV